MHTNAFLLAAYLATSLNALPLNINLGAYSPALVVGDGEISFGGKQDVSNLMNALEGAAVSGAAAAAAQPAAAQQAQPAAAQVQPAAAAVLPTTGESTTQITALQGMGKEIAPRVVQLVQENEGLAQTAKRDIAGFNAALNYATGALKISPEVQLGTGEGGSGVGITQKAGGAPATVKTAPAARDLKERDETLLPKMRTTVTTMFVRGGSAPAADVARDVLDSVSSPMEKRAPVPAPSPNPGAIDGVNLNMAEGQVAELTFVETRAVEDDE